MELYTTLGEYMKANASEEKRRFTAKFPHPFLLVDLSQPKAGSGGFATFQGPGDSQKSTDFDAVIEGSARLLVMPVVKTGRNTFKDMVTVGRASNNDLVISNGSVSKFHAFFRKDPVAERFKVFDAGSSYGTRVNNETVPPNQGMQVASSDTVVFAKIVPATFFASADLHDYMQLLMRAERG